MPQTNPSTSGVRTEASILHVDLDAFYASVEQLENPKLRNSPVVVGGIGTRGVVCAASYEARKFGVRSAMPTAQARKLCPQGTFLVPRMGLYGEFSQRVMAILRDTTPLVEQLSVDEAFLDVASVHRLLGDPEEVGAHLRERVLSEIGLSLSVGIATTKFLAKVASDQAKPNGLLVVHAGGELAFLHPLPIRVLWGVGPKNAEKLQRIGVKTVGDVARVGIAPLVAAVGKAVGTHLFDLANNRDPRPIVTDREAKSIGHEETFGEDIRTRPEIERELFRLIDSVGSRIRKAGLSARTVTLKARYSDFQTVTRSHTLDSGTAVSGVIARTVFALLDQVDHERGLRLVGVHCSNFDDGSGAIQGTLAFGDANELQNSIDERRAEVDRVVDDVRRRFGKDAVQPAARIGMNDRQNPTLAD